MKTLTITDVKKNLSRWLAAAASGEDIGIICGADIIARRKVTVESMDYAQREYGATPEPVAALEKATDRRYRKLKRSGELVTVTTAQLRKMIGQGFDHRPSRDTTATGSCLRPKLPTRPIVRAMSARKSATRASTSVKAYDSSWSP